MAIGLRYVVTGSRGQLGRCLVRRLGLATGAVLAGEFARDRLDVSDAGAVADALAMLPGGPPDVLLNAAAFNQVDSCEGDGSDDARRVNAEAPGILARAAEGVGARLVHVSTDYVFPGDATSPIPEDAAPGPRTAYGRSKLAGEVAALEASPRSLVVRTSWVFGPGRNFVGAILRQARLRREGEVEGPLRVVDDQRGYPTYADDLAMGILELAQAVEPGTDSTGGGIYHLCNGPDPADDGPITWWDFARSLLDARGFGDLQIDRISTEESGARAPRPAYSVLGCDRALALGVRLRSWRQALDAYLGSPDLTTTLELQDPSARVQQ